MLSWVYHSENLFWYQSWVELNQRPSFGSPHCWIYQECLELVDGPDPRAAEELRGSKFGWGMVRSTVRMGRFLFFKLPLFVLFLRIPMTYLDEVLYNFHRALTKKSGHWIRIRGHSCKLELATVSFTLELFVLGGALWIVYWLIISIISYAFTAEAFVSASILYVNHDQ